MDPNATQLVLTTVYDFSFEDETGDLMLEQASTTITLQPKPTTSATAAAKRPATPAKNS